MSHVDETVTHVFQPIVTMRRSARGWELKVDFRASYSHTVDTTPGCVPQYEGGPEADRAAHDLDVWLAGQGVTVLEIPAADSLNKPRSPASPTKECGHE